MKFDLENSHERRRMPVKFEHIFSKQDDGPMLRGEEYFQERYLLTLKVYTEFWSNAAQLPQKKACAEDLVHAHLFKDMIPLVKGILLEADNRTVYSLAESLLKKMQGSHE
jgi:hypothetical protein